MDSTTGTMVKENAVQLYLYLLIPEDWELDV
jgi:hypothetical protein